MNNLRKVVTIVLVLVPQFLFAQFNPDGSFKVGSYFNIFPSGRVAGNVIFGHGSDQDGGNIRGNASGLEFLTKNAEVWYTRLVITNSGSVGVGITNPVFNLSTNNNGVIASTTLRLQNSYLDNGNYGIQLVGIDNGVNGHNLHFQGRTSTTGSFSNLMILTNSGQLGVGTTTMGTHKLAVNGSIGAREIKVEASGWSDFVFRDDYELRTLEQVEAYILENKHLPEIPNEVEIIEKGINLGEMDAKLLQKIEELTLYLIDLNKHLRIQNEKVERLENENRAMRKMLLRL